ncbi:MAG TPA: anthranilate synthase component I family protein [Candidatus Thermoplasmatota archaeon]|nr:anthranilate synthase component I family protein [Candidatus Thermoplasmatota archaeon]
MLRVRLQKAPPPHEAHARLAARHATTFLLESRTGPDRLARFSFVGWDPVGTLELDADGLRIEGDLPKPRKGEPPVGYLRRTLRRHRVADQRHPFVGGFVGSVGSDFSRTLEPGLEAGADEAWPRLLLGLYLDAIVYDHAKGTAHYVSVGADRRADLEALARRPSGQRADALKVGAVKASHARPAFTRMVREAQELIRAGECFQVVLSRSYTAPFRGDLAACYDWLRRRAHAPYLFFLRFGGAAPRALLGASPETLVRVRQGMATTFPIAGTRPLTGRRGADAAAAAELKADPKENAEHAMLVDLARNDLARVSRPGTVQVVRLAKVEPFRTVQHLVSEVRGRLRPGQDALDALAAVFPAGTVSGAPKVRALEHLERLEARPRGPYAGAVCYLSFNGDLDSCIAIRCLSATDGHLVVQAGAGIVLGSRPDSEFDETRHKARLLLSAVERFGGRLPKEDA